jgi:glycosyltransferase involved in cell wall biosynthesis
MHMLDVSIVTPTFNRAKLLPRVWQSLIGQNANFEWIVVDDGSIDNTADIVKSFNDKRIVFVPLFKNKGVNTARNRGVAIAQGRYIMFLDSDDELICDGLSDVVRIFDKAEDCIGAIVFVCIMAATGKVVSEVINGKILNEIDIVCNNGLRGGDKICIYRREVFSDCLLPEDLRGCEQIFVYGVAKKWKYLTINKILSIIHRQNDNLSDANSVIDRSLDIAKSYERLIKNHSEILKNDFITTGRFLRKALYRYIVAGSTEDAWRTYKRIFHQSKSLKIIFTASALMAIIVFHPVWIEKLRIKLLTNKLLDI